MTPVPRYAVLVIMEEASPLFMGMGGGEPKRTGRLICSSDEGQTWTLVNLHEEADVRQVAETLTRDAHDKAVAALRYSIERAPDA